MGRPTRELTPLVILLGLLLSVVMGMANVYLGLKAGMTVSASIPAAVVGMLILRALSPKSSVLEANQIQTAASAGESLAAGIIFTMPALILIGTWQKFDMLMTTVIAFTGGLLGILFMIPMRRVFVTSDKKELTFPEGVACAAVLEAGAQEAHAEQGKAVGKSGGVSAAMVIVWGAAIGGLFKFTGGFLHLLKHTLEGATMAAGRVLYLGGDISPALVAVGLIVRLNVALLIFIGGALAWCIGIPLLGEADSALTALDNAWAIWSGKIRYVGVGAMVVGGLFSIFKVRHGLLEALRILSSRMGGDDEVSSGSEPASEKDRDLPGSAIALLSLLAVICVGGVYFVLTGSIVITIPTTIIMVVMAFFFTAVASYIVGLVGNSNSPVSGMTITAVLFTGGLLYVFGFSGNQGMLATLGVAAIVCCAACTSGDVCNDLKTGQLVGATPWKQQLMQVGGVAVASLVMAPTLQLLHDNTPGGIGGKELAAPQAQLFASLAKGFFGDGALPWGMVGIGVGVGVVIVIIDAVLEAKQSSFRAHIMPIAVGMYLPFGLAIPILLGGIIAHVYSKGLQGKEAGAALHRGVLFSSGIIAGESLMGVGLALLASAGLSSLALDLPATVPLVLTVAAAIAVLFAFVRFSRPAADG